jgi:hypothetical protein
MQGIRNKGLAGKISRNKDLGGIFCGRRKVWRGDGYKIESAQDPSQVESAYAEWGRCPAVFFVGRQLSLILYGAV